MSKSRKVYISYNPADNKKDSNQRGWVDEFIRVLQIFLVRVNGESPELIALDSGKSAPALEENDGVIIICSDNYLKDKTFQNISAHLGDLNKLFKVDLAPMSRSKIPKELSGLNEFKLFSTGGKKNDSIVVLDGRRTAQVFGLKVIDLAFEITRVLYQKGKQASLKELNTIFLAETSHDQIANRDDVKRELLRHGFEVLPKTPFSSDLKEFKNQVSDCLKKASITVQLIGEQYGEVLEGSDQSVIEIQNDLATNYFTKSLTESEHSLHRLIWMPLGLRPTSDQQKIYLDKLREDISSTAGAEIIQTPLEILKTIIHSRLQLFEKEKMASQKLVQTKSDKKHVYLLFDQKDSALIDSLKAAMSEKNISVILPDFSGKQIELLQKHRDSLVKSDGVLLFANKNLNWLNSKLNDVVKAPGFGKIGEFQAKAIVINDASIPKERISHFNDLIMLNGNKNGSNTTDLSPFIDKIATL